MLKSLSSLGNKMAALLQERTDYGVVESPSLKLMNQYLETYPLSSLLPYRSYDVGTGLFHNENSVGFILETSPMIGSTEAMQREISGLFQHTLPEGSHIQFILWADPGIESFLKRWKKVRETQHPIFQKLAERRVAHLQKMGIEGDPNLPSLTIRNLRCIVAFSRPGVLDNPVEEQKLLSVRDHVHKALETLGMPVERWDANDLLNTLNGIINGGAGAPALKWNPFDSLNQQIPLSGKAIKLPKRALP
jgi:conjugal transfer ATP-binding protein TraC